MTTQDERRRALEALEEVVQRCLYPDGKDVVSSDPEGAGFIFYRKVIGAGHLQTIRKCLQERDPAVLVSALEYYASEDMFGCRSLAGKSLAEYRGTKEVE